jgi:hypothetical protein
MLVSIAVGMPADIACETPFTLHLNVSNSRTGPGTPGIPCGPVGPVIVTVIYPLESVTAETPAPVKLIPVTPTPTLAPLKYVLMEGYRYYLQTH